MAKVAPTINAVTPTDYGERIDRVKSFAKRLHVDVGDGVFDDVRTVGLSQVYGIDSVPLDLHLMIEHPESQLHGIASLQPSLVIIHYEASIDRREFYRELRSLGIRPGLAVDHDTTIDQVGDELKLVDHLLIFTGTLGHNKGQFHTESLAKIAQARQLNSLLEIAVDGGIDLETGRQATAAGAEPGAAQSLRYRLAEVEQGSRVREDRHGPSLGARSKAFRRRLG